MTSRLLSARPPASDDEGIAGGRRMPAGRSVRLWCAVLAVVGALLVGCGAGGTSDSSKLKSLRSEADSYLGAGGQERAHRIEALVTSAMDIAARNQGKPIGAEAFAFAQQEYLRGADYDMLGLLFTTSTPALPACSAAGSSATGVGVGHVDLESFHDDLGFLSVVPAPYQATDVTAKIHEALLNNLDTYVRELEARVADRARWVADMQSKGSTAASWYGVIGQAGLRCLKQVTTKAKEDAALMAAWNSVASAAVIADSYQPAPVRGVYRNGVFVSTYTRATLSAAQRHLKQLRPAVTAARKARDRATAR